MPNSTPTKTPGKSGNPAWVPGKSGNPGGKHKDLAKFRAAARTMSWQALSVICELLENSKDEKVRLKAAEVLLDRAWGKAPPAEIEDGGDTGAEFVVSIKPTKPKDQLIEMEPFDENNGRVGN